MIEKLINIIQYIYLLPSENWVAYVITISDVITHLI